MSPRFQVAANAFSLALIAGVFVFLYYTTARSEPEYVRSAPAQATSTAQVGTSTPSLAPASTTAPTKKKSAPVARVTEGEPYPNASSSTAAADTTMSQAARIESPYSFPPKSTDQANTETRAALVNIICMSNGSIRPISGSGVIIDARGVILTNAHVAQYVLLSQDHAIDLSCTIRTGSPARPMWTASVLYMPPVWVATHASEINSAHPVGTGEHDYALLLINGSATGTSLPVVFPFLPVDMRSAIGFTGDQVLVAGYPAEFIGGVQAQQNLYAATSISAIGTLMTFGTGSVDVISLGGVIQAQSGSSGGAAVNPWGHLIGLISTTSDGATTADRDLHALTLSYIDRDLNVQTGSSLSAILGGNLFAEQADFDTRILPDLMSTYMKQIKPAQ